MDHINLSSRTPPPRNPQHFFYSEYYTRVADIAAFPFDEQFARSRLSLYCDDPFISLV